MNKLNMWLNSSACIEKRKPRKSRATLHARGGILTHNPRFERPKELRALNCAATHIGPLRLLFLKNATVPWIQLLAGSPPYSLNARKTTQTYDTFALSRNS